VCLVADEGGKRFRVHVPKLAETTAAHFALPTETRDAVADVTMCTCDLGGRALGDAADVNFVGR
jgi:hypothetical protein